MTVTITKANSEKKSPNLTAAAKKHLVNCLSKNPNYKGVRFSVNKTGCSGFSYVVDYVENTEDEDYVFPFTENFLLCIDKKSYPLIQGMEVDYVQQGLNYKFQFKNPNQTGQCGCGESFTID